MCLSHIGWCCKNRCCRKGLSFGYVNTDTIVSNTTDSYYNACLYCIKTFDCGLHSYYNFYFKTTLYIVKNSKLSCSVYKDRIIYNDT